MSKFHFEGEGNDLFSELKKEADYKILARLIQAPLHIQEMLLAFAKKEDYQLKFDENQEYRYKEKDSIVDWLHANQVLLESNGQLNGWNLYVSSLESEGKITITRNSEIAFFFDELERVSKNYKKDLISINQKYTSIIYAYWLYTGKKKSLELELTDFHEILDLNPTLYYSYQQIEKRLKIVSGVLESCGIKMKYQKNDPKYGTYEILEFS